MKTKFSPFFLTYLVEGFISSLGNINSVVWQPLTEYPVGQVVSHTNEHGDTNTYISLSGTKSGVKSPTHNNIGGIETDGGIRWLFIDKDNTIDSRNKNMYITFGKKNGSAANEPILTSQETIKSLREVVYVVKVNKNDCSILAKRNTWESGKVFDMFDVNREEEYDNPHYTTNNEGKIYLCLFNNNGNPSQNEPTSESADPITMADGYSWLYIGKVSAIKSKFLSNEFIPITNAINFTPFFKEHRNGISALNISASQVGAFLATDEINIELINAENGSGAEFSTVVNNAGIIERVDITKTGEFYSNDTKAILSVKGESGSGATADIIIDEDTGGIKEVIITNGGMGYKKAVIVIEGDGSGAAITLEVSTNGIISNAKIDNAGSGYTEARAYIIAGESGNVAKASIMPYTSSNTSIISMLGDMYLNILVDINPTSNYFALDSEYSEIMLVTNLYEKDNFTLCKRKEYIGQVNPLWADDENGIAKISPNEGFVLYKQNMDKVRHVAGQIERINLLIEL